MPAVRAGRFECVAGRSSWTARLLSMPPAASPSGSDGRSRSGGPSAADSARAHGELIARRSGAGGALGRRRARSRTPRPAWRPGRRCTRSSHRRRRRGGAGNRYARQSRRCTRRRRRSRRRCRSIRGSRRAGSYRWTTAVDRAAVIVVTVAVSVAAVGNRRERCIGRRVAVSVVQTSPSSQRGASRCEGAGAGVVDRAGVVVVAGRDGTCAGGPIAGSHRSLVQALPSLQQRTAHAA
jgi:hypothetical protein